ncbi:hypothetical protein O181_080575 [Austropuccinia psidii MF-1]|uniref:Uncharacterized protein n=1 Tax=Austropuccinia psidii MF-1 TaxID=1389203 RepID=A0A9Q3FNG1_9BASI|nr:hypothetical protein [Austropuccinia psidii MF-1]
MTVCIDDAQHPFIMDSGAHCFIVARNYLDNHSPNWEKQLFKTKAKSFKSASGKMTSIWTIIKEIIIRQRKVNIRLNPELVVLEDAHIQGLYWKQITRECMALIFTIVRIGTLLLFREGQFSTSITIKQKLSLLKMLRRNRPAFSIGEKQLGKIKGHDIELYLDVEGPYPSMLRRPAYAECLETRKEIEKYINELLDMDVIRKIGHNERVEITTPVLIANLGCVDISEL